MHRIIGEVQLPVQSTTFTNCYPGPVRALGVEFGPNGPLLIVEVETPAFDFSADPQPIAPAAKQLTVHLIPSGSSIPPYTRYVGSVQAGIHRGAAMLHVYVVEAA